MYFIFGYFKSAAVTLNTTVDGLQGSVWYDPDNETHSVYDQSEEKRQRQRRVKRRVVQNELRQKIMKLM